MRNQIVLAFVFAVAAFSVRPRESAVIEVTTTEDTSTTQCKLTDAVQAANRGTSP